MEQQIRQAFFSAFTNAEDVYKYLVKVGTVLVVQKEKITELFKKIQHSYSELFFHGRILFKECKDLELLKDYFKTRVAYLKQRMHILEKEKEEFERTLKKEQELKKEYFKKSNVMERRAQEAQQEMQIHRQRSQKYEQEIKRLEK